MFGARFGRSNASAIVSLPWVELASTVRAARRAAEREASSEVKPNAGDEASHTQKKSAVMAVQLTDGSNDGCRQRRRRR